MVSETFFEKVDNLRKYKLTINMGFATLRSEEGMTTTITDKVLLETLIDLGVKYSYCNPNAGLSLVEVGHEE